MMTQACTQTLFIALGAHSGVLRDLFHQNYGAQIHVFLKGRNTSISLEG